MKHRRIVLTILGLLLLASLGYGLFLFFIKDGEAAETSVSYSLGHPRRGTISATVDASGSIQPAETVRLDFRTTGIVKEVLVEVNDIVEKGDSLARLDTSELELNVATARASLAQAQASYDKLLEEATPAEIAQVEGKVKQAQAQFRQVQSEVSEQDIVAARAELEQAQEALAELEAGADSEDIDSARASLELARANLQSQRDSLAASKIQAKLQMEQAANTLRDRQADYSNLYWNNRERERDWDSPNADISQDVRDREEAMLRSVKNAEDALEQARVSYEQAQQAEISGIQAAEAEVRNAQAKLDKLLSGADPDELAAARAQIERARANLTTLVGDARSAGLESAQASIDIAKAQLEQILEPPAKVDLASAQAQVDQADVALKQAKIELEKATLRAPIDGTIAEVNVKVGERETPTVGRHAIILADLSRFYVYGTVDEIDVGKLAVGQDAYLTLDALQEVELVGKVDTISPLSDEESAVATYAVRIETQTSDERVRSGMSANADIIVDQKSNALLVPRRAVYSEEGTRFVDVINPPTLCEAERSTWPQEPDIEQVEVTTGLSNERDMEILSDNISEESCLYIEGIDARLDPFSGPPPGHSRRRGE